MNVLMTADAVGGVFAYAVELAGALAQRGASVALAAMGGFLDAGQWEAAREVPGLEVFESAGKLEWMEEPWEDVRRDGAWLLDLAENLRPDVVHLNDYAHGALPFAAPKVVVAHSCALSWFEAVRREPLPPALDRYRHEVSRGLAAADLVVAPTRSMLDGLERHYGALPAARVIPNGRSAVRFPPGEKEGIVLCAGRLWDAAKTASLLDAVAAELPWPVLLAGEEEHPDPAHRGRREPRRARSLGHLDALALSRFYARSAIYALPARYEPSGLSVLEAALAGCALVLGDIPSLRETWEGAALFVDPDAPEMLRSLLAGLIEREDLRTQLSALARERALHLTPERMADSYFEAYQELVLGGRRDDATSCGP
jgi:glycogen(starch) synthase